MHQRRFGVREKAQLRLSALSDDLAAVRRLFQGGEFLAAIDGYEQLAQTYPQEGVAILAELYDRYQLLPQRDRYHLYQARHFDFGILPGDRVLDVGSGHIPFPLATHLSDITLKDDSYGRAGVPFREVAGKPVYECSVEEMPFADKEFDFVYCSHVLEHTADPERACRELMRVGKRGYIETPTRAKDIFLASARPSNHTRSVEVVDGRLVFRDYSETELEGLSCDILQGMHCAPQTMREKAFAALIWLKADVVNTMLLWDGAFQFEVAGNVTRGAAPACAVTTPRPEEKLTFMQVHTFYPRYLDDFYRRHPEVTHASFAEQVNALVRDGFSGIHMFAPYLGELGYEPHLVVANNAHAQGQWLKEEGIDYRDDGRWLHDVVRLQIETIRPQVLYLSDPINFDSDFVRSLSYKPAVVFGWRAANIAPGTDWSAFDIILSSLSSLRAVALTLGARAAEHFFPGFPAWVNVAAGETEPVYDVVFSGSWTADQHPRRNRYLVELARAAAAPGAGFTLGLFINAPAEALPPEVQRFNRGGCFGVAMHRALASGRIVVDARGILEYRDPISGAVTDLAQEETANMRIFEATGSGRLLLTEHHKNLGDYFEPGVEIETFRNEGELLEKIDYYLKHPEKREAIARRGQERCLRDYSMERRAEALDRIIRRHLPESAGAPAVATAPPPPAAAETPAAALLDQATQALERGEAQHAFDLLVQAKALKEPLQGLDLVRARCFVKMEQPMAALEAIREELRWFPENAEARAMLALFEAQGGGTVSGSVGDGEFRELLAKIRPYTMLSEQRLYSLFAQAKEICTANRPGNFVECGVAAGGSSALLAYVIKKYSTLPRRLFSFDSFSGMPEPTDADTHGGIDAQSTGWGTGTCSAPEASVLEICGKLGVADVITPVKGYFEETLPRLRDWVGMVALLHLDGDWYSSTKAILDNLYDRLTQGAVMQVDDYGYWDGCRKAIHEFEEARGVKFSIAPIDGTGVWFVKPDPFPMNREIPPSLVEEFRMDDPAPKGVTSQMSVNERFQLYYAVRNELPATDGVVRFVEIGSYSGASLLLTHQALARSGKALQGICVEPGGTPQFHEVVRLLKDDVIHLPLFSHDASQRLKEMLQDDRLPHFIFVDGDHTYEGVRQDILDFYPLLKPGGVMMFHDYTPELNDDNRAIIEHHHGGKEPGIRRACRELMEEELGCRQIELPLLYPTDPTQTQPQLPIIPGVFSTVRAYRKPAAL